MHAVFDRSHDWRSGNFSIRAHANAAIQPFLDLRWGGVELRSRAACRARPSVPNFPVKSMWKGSRRLEMENRTEPRTVGQWIRYLVVAAIALFLVWWMLRLYVL